MVQTERPRVAHNRIRELNVLADVCLGEDVIADVAAELALSRDMCNPIEL